ncbi:Putative LOC100114766, partial [Caligus rogercresseyi]
QSLRERLNKGLSIDLDDEEFSVHEVASVFKSFLADLPEPLLTDSYYGAHVQVTGLEDEDPKRSTPLSTPQGHAPILHKVSRHQDRNKMSASNLGTVFSTHILCPRKISAEALKSNHVLLTKSVGFMIQRAPELFDVPDQLTTDIKLYWNQRKKNAGSLAVSEPSPPGSPVVNTVFTFVDRRTTKEVSKESSTDTALAALYAHVQALPESAQKKKLIQRLNDANGCGTPGRVTPSAVSSSKKGLRAGVVGGPLRKTLHSSHQGEMAPTASQLPSRATPSSILLSDKLWGLAQSKAPLPPAAINSSTPQRVTSLLRDHKKTITTPNGLQGPSIDLHSPLRAQEGQEHSPITSVALKMPSEMQETLMTPRCRRPVMAMIVEPTESPCQPSKYNEDEPSPLFNDEEGEEEEGISSSSCDESDKYFESLEDDDDLDQSLLPEFKKYILEKVAGKKTEGISEEVNELLNGELALSESMRMVLDGVDPEPSVLEPVDVDEMPQDYEKGNDENHLSHGPLIHEPIVTLQQ